MKRTTLMLSVGATLLLVFGCRREVADKHLIEISVKLKEQQGQLDRIETAVQSLRERLHAIETSDPERPAVGEEGVGDGRSERQPTSIASRREYQDIMGQIAVVQSQLIGLEQEILMFRHGEEQARKLRERQALRDQGAAWQAMGEPDELSRRLDILLKDFSEDIEDPLARDAFVADVEQMKSRYLTPLSPEQKREQAREAIVGAFDLMPDEQSRTWLAEQLKALDEASNPLEVSMRVDVTLQLQRMREMQELAQKHSIPAQVMRDSGLLFLPTPALPGTQ